MGGKGNNDNKNNSKNAVWLYAVILFTSAFIVLLITAYSQIKLNTNLSDYKDKLTTEENAKNDIKNNLGITLSENSRLNEELKYVKEELEKTKTSLDEANEKLKGQLKTSEERIKTYESLLRAKTEYDKGDIYKSADIVYNEISKDLLDDTGLNIYDSFAQDLIGQAAESHYIEGYDNYINRNYDDAIYNLKKSYDYSKDKYFSDDSLYFIGYSYYRQGKLNEMKEYMEKLISLFPDSSYINEARSMVENMIP